MKKNGFTLVELLAVIAILAILVIIALPNVMGMFNTAKKNSFSNEVKEVIKQGKTQFVTDSGLNFGGGVTSLLCYQNKMEGNSDDTVSVSSVNAKKLDMSGRSISYALCFDQANRITSLAATDGTYFVTCDGTDIQEQTITVADGAYSATNSEHNCKIFTITDTAGKTGAKIVWDASTKKVSAVLTPTN